MPQPTDRFDAPDGAASEPVDADRFDAGSDGAGGILAWRGDFTNDEVNELHAEGFGHRVRDQDWVGRLERHSLGWVAARRDGRLVGFVNVAWDGGVHAFLLDTVVAGDQRRSGIGARMVDLCAQEARAAGCTWLHVDFEAHLAPFYIEACGFRPTDAGLIALS